MTTPQIERDRAARIAQNKKRLEDLKLPEAAKQLAASLKTQTKTKKVTNKKRSTQQTVQQSPRRSSRHVGNARDPAHSAAHLTMSASPTDPKDAVIKELRCLDPAFPDEACCAAAEEIMAAGYTADQVASGALVKEDRLKAWASKTALAAALRTPMRRAAGVQVRCHKLQPPVCCKQ
jgi:FAD/FMN-containing dehydrogenase